VDSNLKDHVYGHLEFLGQAQHEIFWSVIIQPPGNIGVLQLAPCVLLLTSSAGIVAEKN
jgi:hypothetical protein